MVQRSRAMVRRGGSPFEELLCAGVSVCTHACKYVIGTVS